MTKQPQAILEEQNKIFGYSERGIINSLIFNIGEDKNLLREFIGLIKLPYPIDVGEPKKYTILLEQSFSRFGDADLIIIIHYENKEDKKVLFFEGKVKTYKKNWNIETEFGKYIEPINSEHKIRPKNYWSNLFSQLYLKKSLIDNWIEINEKGGVKLLESERDRKIGENKIVLKAFKKLNGCKQNYYIGLIPTLEENIKKFKGKTDFDLHFLSWETVHKFCKDNKLKKVLKMFKYNDGQIY
ncbi:hypothetical protein [Flavobacterium psychrotolerans]|uniref:Uncharacterized protein n=1 Tax=Flavobacterium psychrotolerans TaxID=2169410 RepID=A0A2U1JKD2_9FLAO|nr:hypothetical protein [Flavobacterium psychrotolerans]PWA05600.1 hypothetical protein DB895_06355 [Flavobacterium psychrotolerans]